MNTMPRTPAAKSGPKPKPTAEQRKAAKLEAQAAAEALELAEENAFLAKSPLIWSQLFAKALRVALIMPGYRRVVEDNDWWFDTFQVDPRAQTVRIHVYQETWAEGELDAKRADRMLEELDSALEWFDEEDARAERERQEALAKEARRQAALSKLTDEDKVALGLNR